MGIGNILFIVVVIVVAIVLIIWVAGISARARRMSAASDARLAAQFQDMAEKLSTGTPPAHEPVEAGVADDGGAPEASTKESRLVEVGDLHARGLISDAELAAARAKILAE